MIDSGIRAPNNKLNSTSSHIVHDTSTQIVPEWTVEPDCPWQGYYTDKIYHGGSVVQTVSPLILKWWQIARKPLQRIR